MATFKIDHSFKLINHGLVIVGELLSGSIKPNDILQLKDGPSLRIKSIESVDNIAEQIFRTGLLFHYENEEQQEQLENLKVTPQIAVIEDC
ncbi:hypothetical protein GFS24_07860 [Chitinophaga sp. SYP-B3965]|uniref:hypothetical protein n=1 Tax=Chitinophaga sp. SYP-B3965 TaxID=2663120 RepID=UPI001299668D|nr:hypothetical protein [Chitinophaga sp. SYP-B3965]MRG45025.1 hypothetical protein [Chitinophaga sp. SYP-B3965]